MVHVFVLGGTRSLSDVACAREVRKFTPNDEKRAKSAETAV